MHSAWLILVVAAAASAQENASKNNFNKLTVVFCV
jgi:hypothetical protein